MRGINVFPAVCAVFILSSTCIVSGCTTLRKITKPVIGTNAVPGVSLPPYTGLRISVFVADFDIKAYKASGQTAAGLKEMLVAVLGSTNRFTVVDVPASPDKVQTDAAASLAGPARQADIVITISVAQFEPQASGGSAGMGGGGGAGNGMMGGLWGASLNKAHMALDIAILDAASSHIVASSRIYGQASDVGGSVVDGFMVNPALPLSLAMYANTPMEKAVRVCLFEAARYISQNIPAKYYKYAMKAG